MEQIRSFIAVELPEEAVSALEEIQSGLKAAGNFPVKWVDPRSIHLTLKFLGNVSSGSIAGIEQAIREAVSGIPPVQLKLCEPGVFPNPVKTRIIWVGVEGDIETLGTLQQRLEKRLAALGFPPDGKAFTPHLTLGRVQDNATTQDRKKLGKLVTTTRLQRNCSFNASAVHLMRSSLTSAGAVYSRLATINL